MVNELILPESMKVIAGTNDYGTLFEVDKTNWVEMNACDEHSYLKTKEFDKMYNYDMRKMHGIGFDSKIMRDPGNTGGKSCFDEVDASGKNIMFTGKIDWYSEDTGLGRIAGNRVGVMIKFPDNVTDEDLEKLRIHIAGKVYDQTALDEHEGKKVLWYYPLVKSSESSYRVYLTWGEPTLNEMFNIFISPTTQILTKEETEAAASESETTEDGTEGTSLSVDATTVKAAKSSKK